MILKCKLTSASWHISRARSLKLHGAALGFSHWPPLVKSPPQYLVAIRLPSCDVILPQGQWISARSPMLDSGHSIDIVKFGFPEFEGMSVMLERQPSVNRELVISICWSIFSYQIDQLD